MYDAKDSKQCLKKLLQGSTQPVWSQALSNELGRIAQGLGHVNGNNVVSYNENLMFRQDVPYHMPILYLILYHYFRQK